MSKKYLLAAFSTYVLLFSNTVGAHEGDAYSSGKSGGLSVPVTDGPAELSGEAAFVSVKGVIKSRSPIYQRFEMAYIIRRVRVFYFDHIRAHICEHHCREGTW